jgi:D-alanyl-D-alanine carboxypeptidase
LCAQPSDWRIVRRLALVLAIAAAAAVTAAPAQAGLTARLHGQMRALVRAGVPGVVVHVRRGSTVIDLAAGQADPAEPRAMTTDDRFKVGSITKTFVATAVLQLVGEGRLGLDDTVSQWLPGLVPNGGHITVRELLMHTSGLFDYLDDPRPLAPYLALEFRHFWTPRQLVRIAVSHPALFPPGAGFSYTNTGYILLGLIAERAGGERLAVQLRRRIFAPLHLSQTRLPASQGLGQPRARGFLRVQGGLEDVTAISQSVFGAAGGVVSTARDVGRFYRGLLNGHLLPPRLLRAMTAMVPRAPGFAYGLGLFRIPTPCGPAFGHDGELPGYASLALNGRHGRRQAVVLVNSNTPSETVGPPAAQAAYTRLIATAFCGRP